MKEKSKDWSTLSSTAYEINEKQENIYIERILKRIQLGIQTRGYKEWQDMMVWNKVGDKVQQYIYEVIWTKYEVRQVLKMKSGQFWGVVILYVQEML